MSSSEMEAATKELLELKNKYMADTQNWLKTDSVHHEELQIIRRRVFEAIQRKRAELHKAAAVVEAAGLAKKHGKEKGLSAAGGNSHGNSSRRKDKSKIKSKSKIKGKSAGEDSGTGAGGAEEQGPVTVAVASTSTLTSISTSTSTPSQSVPSPLRLGVAATGLSMGLGGPEEEEAERTIGLIAGTAELLQYKQLLSLLNAAIRAAD
ncbi:unnamed protein product [Discosporangium mesarthrocarpum]